VPFVVVEMDRAIVEDLRRRGIDALWGDAGSPVLLDRANVATARAVALTAPDPVTQRLALEHIRSVQPEAQILVRAHDDASMEQFERMPNTRAVHGERSLGLKMARELLVALGSNRVEADLLMSASIRAAAPSSTRLQLFEVVVPGSAACVGKSIAELRLPAAALVVAIVRDGAHQIARGNTCLCAQDSVLVVATSEAAREVERELLLSAGAG
jgi:CPA2 family monovalent cation:H+ antiporter-2